MSYFCSKLSLKIPPDFCTISTSSYAYILLTYFKGVCYRASYIMCSRLSRLYDCWQTACMVGTVMTSAIYPDSRGGQTRDKNFSGFVTFENLFCCHLLVVLCLHVRIVYACLQVDICSYVRVHCISQPTGSRLPPVPCKSRVRACMTWREPWLLMRLHAWWVCAVTYLWRRRWGVDRRVIVAAAAPHVLPLLLNAGQPWQIRR